MGLYNGSLADYYGGLETQGAYQFISIKDVINNFIVAYVGEDKIIPKISRADVRFHASRAIQELTYDTFRSCKTLELEVANSLTLPLPHDFVNHVKISSIDANGNCHPLHSCQKCPKDPLSYEQLDSGVIDVGELQEDVTTTYTTGEGEKVDIVIAVDSSNSVHGNDNVSNMMNFILDFVTSLETELSDGRARIGLVHFGAGRNTIAPLALGQNVDGSDTMFDIGQQLKLTDDKVALETWVDDIYQNASGSGGSHPAQDTPAGTSIISGVWCGLNLLYGDNSRNVSKKLITIIDGPQSSMADASIPTTLTSTEDIYDNMTVLPLTPDVTPDDVVHGANDRTNSPASYGWDNPTSGAGEWFQDNVVNNAQYTDLETFGIVVDPWGYDPNGTAVGDNSGDVEATWLAYTAQFADSTDNTWGGSFNTTGSTAVIVDDIITAISPPTVAVNTVNNYYEYDPIEEDSTTWANLSSGSSSGSSGSSFSGGGNARYGLNTQGANINGCFWTNCRTGKIHFDSSLSGKTVTIQYISDSVATDGEMLVHKFAEEAVYKWIIYAILSTRSVPDPRTATFGKEKSAAIRNAKLRLSSIKPGELIQVLRGKSKWIKH